MKQTLTTLAVLVIIGALALLARFLFMKDYSSNNPPMENPSASVSPKLPAGSTPPGNPDYIQGARFTWVEGRYLTTGEAPVKAVQPSKFTITFGADGKVSGTTDCNSFGGDYQLGSEGVITFGPMVRTEMYCGARSQENIFLDMLSKTNHYQVIQELNTVILDSDEVMMVFQKQ